MRVIRLFIVLIALQAWSLPVAAQEADPAGPAAYPDPVRFEDDIQKFERADAERMPPEGAVVCVGSSSMRMWHGQIAGDLAPLTVVPRGFGGSNMNDLLHYADRLVLKYKPRAVLIYEGDNDVGQGVAPEKIAETFDALVERIHAVLPECRVYVLSVKPSIARWALWPAMQRVNTLLAEACADNELLTYIDIATPMLGEDGGPKPELFVEDKLHMTRAGYELWRDTVRPVLVESERRYELEENRNVERIRS